MAADKPGVLVLGPAKKIIVEGLGKTFAVHHFAHPKELAAALAETVPAKLQSVRGIAVSGPPGGVNAALMARLPALEMISSFGVGYDNIDASHAGQHGIVVTNTPDVLNEEVADTALGLLLATVRQFPQAERYLRAGKWTGGDYPLTPSLRNRTVGIVGLGRIGQVIARRLEAMNVPVVYHTRRPRADLPYRHYPELLAMARDADVLLVITPGGAETRHLINAAVLQALGPDGILVNMARGSVVDEAALIAALTNGTILAAGLDVYAKEPHVPAELIAMDHVVLFPHLGSSSLHTRTAMEQLVVDNLLAWHAGKPALTPVPETAAVPKRA